MTEVADDQLAEEGEPASNKRYTLSRLSARVSARLNPKPDATNEFPMGQEELVSMLQTEDPELAADILIEAREIASAMVSDRIESVERRATTLQGVVAVAATFTLAGGSLLVTQIHGLAWQLALGCGLFWISTRFVLSGLRATQATSTVHEHRAPPRSRILDRGAQSLSVSRVDRAAYDLRVAGRNSSIARWKVTMLGKARRHLLSALLAVPVLTLLMVAYAAFGAASPQGRTESEGLPKRPATLDATPPLAQTPLPAFELPKSDPSNVEPSRRSAPPRRTQP